MRSSVIRVGDIVYASKRGRLFHAMVLDVNAAGSLLVEPIERFTHELSPDELAGWFFSDDDRGRIAACRGDELPRVRGAAGHGALPRPVPGEPGRRSTCWTTATTSRSAGAS